MILKQSTGHEKFKEWNSSTVVFRCWADLVCLFPLLSHFIKKKGHELCKGNVSFFSARSSLILDKVQSEPYTIGLFIIFSTPAHILR